MRLALAAVALGLALAGPAVAQGQPPQSAVLVMDSERLYLETEYGQRIVAQLDAEVEALRVENDRIVAALTEEERSLTLRRPTMDPAAFRAEAQAFDTKVQGIRRARDAKEVSLQNARITARSDFFVEVRSDIEALMLERGASVILDRRSVFLALAAADVTDAAIARIDESLRANPPAPLDLSPEPDTAPAAAPAEPRPADPAPTDP